MLRYRLISPRSKSHARTSQQDVSHGELTPENFIGLFYMLLVFIALGAAWIIGEQLLICCGAHKPCTKLHKSQKCIRGLPPLALHLHLPQSLPASMPAPAHQQ